MTNIQEEVQKIHQQYGMTEKANYKIQLLCEQYAKEYHEQEVKKLDLTLVSKSVEPVSEVLLLAKFYDYLFPFGQFPNVKDLRIKQFLSQQ